MVQQRTQRQKTRTLRLGVTTRRQLLRDPAARGLQLVDPSGCVEKLLPANRGYCFGVCQVTCGGWAYCPNAEIY